MIHLQNFLVVVLRKEMQSIVVLLLMYTFVLFIFPFEHTRTRLLYLLALFCKQKIYGNSVLRIGCIIAGYFKLFLLSSVIFSCWILFSEFSSQCSSKRRKNNKRSLGNWSISRYTTTNDDLPPHLPQIL